MAAPVLQFKRGAFSNLPALKAGEPGFTTDKYDLYVGLDNNSANNKFFGSHRYWTRETASAGSGINLVENTSGTDYITLRAPASVGAAVTYIFPGSQGPANSVLTNDGSGNLTWGSGSANAVFTGIVTFNTENVDINSGVDISGITTISSTVDSTSKDTGSLVVEGGVGIEKNVHIGAGLSVTGNLYIGGQSEFIGVVTFRGGTINLGDSGTDDVVIGGEFASDLIPTTDNTYSLGSLSKQWKDIYINGTADIDSLTVSGISTFDSAIFAGNGISVAGFSTIYQLNITNNLNVGGLLDVDTGIDIGGNSLIAGITSFTNTTQSISKDDGAVVIDGGVGIEKNVNIGGALNVSGNVTIGGTFVSLKGQDVFIENKDFILGYTTTTSPNDNSANHAGVAIASTEGSPLTSFSATGINTLPDTYKQLMWFKNGTLGFSTDAFAFNYALAIGTTSMASGVVLAVGSGVTASNNSISATNGYFTTINAGSITGTISTATRATTVDTTSTSTNADFFVPFVDTFAGQNGETVRVGAGLSLNPSTGEVKTAGVLSVGSPTALTSYIKAGGGSNAMYLYGNGDVSFQAKVITNSIRSSGDTNNTISLDGRDATFGRNISVTGIATVTGELITGADITVGGNDIKASDGTTAISLTAGTGAVGVASDLTVSGSLFVRGSTTEVNTETLKVEDSLIEIGLVNSGGTLVPPSSDLNIDVGVIFHYYTSSAKKAGVYWDDSVSRVVVSSDLSESSSVITSSTYGALEIGSLWVTDCAGTSQVVSCTGSERFLENITVDAGTF